MGWNHRVLKLHCKEYDEDYYEIRECHYEEGTAKDSIPYMWSTTPCTVGGDDPDDIRWTLNKMLECLDKPVLEEDGDKLREVDSE